MPNKEKYASSRLVGTPITLKRKEEKKRGGKDIAFVMSLFYTVQEQQQPGLGPLAATGKRALSSWSFGAGSFPSSYSAS